MDAMPDWVLHAMQNTRDTHPDVVQLASKKVRLQILKVDKLIKQVNFRVFSGNFRKLSTKNTTKLFNLGRNERRK